VDLSLASKDANVSLLQQVTIERPNSDVGSQSDAVSRRGEVRRQHRVESGSI
jgi:hypothetical protein